MAGWVADLPDIWGLTLAYLPDQHLCNVCAAHPAGWCWARLHSTSVAWGSDPCTRHTKAHMNVGFHDTLAVPGLSKIECQATVPSQAHASDKELDGLQTVAC